MFAGMHWNICHVSVAFSACRAVPVCWLVWEAQEGGPLHNLPQPFMEILSFSLEYVKPTVRLSQL